MTDDHGPEQDAEIQIPHISRWEDPNADTLKPGDPVLPEHIVRTMQAILEAGEMKGIIAIVQLKDGRVWRNNSSMGLIELIGLLEFEKSRVVDAVFTDNRLKHNLEVVREGGQLAPEFMELVQSLGRRLEGGTGE